jgi:poly(3-hydroxybutyrate) depolymerase
MNLAFVNPAYLWYEAAHWMLSPARAATDGTKLFFENPINPITHTAYGRTVAAACELFERTTRRYDKPAFRLATTLVGGNRVDVTERIVWARPFGRVIAFDRALRRPKAQPKLLMVAPMSGHFATLLRGTVDAFLPTHQVFITDWTDARMVPLSEGRFDLDDYIDYLISMFRGTSWRSASRRCR